MIHNGKELNKDIEKLFRRHMACLNDIDRLINEPENKKTLTFKAIKSSGMDLTLVWADYQCEKCGCKDNLTLHHLIKKKCKLLMNLIKYLKQRWYFGNQIILCKKCHGEEDGCPPDQYTTITKEKISMLKKKYSTKE